MWHNASQRIRHLASPGDGLMQHIPVPPFPAMHITNSDSESCYEGIIEDRVVGVVMYKRIGGRVVIRHTVIERESRGKGLGAQLVRAVLDDLRERGDKLTNYCGFVADFIADNPEYQSIVDAEHPGVTAPV
jgi:predicted GNAT family acetyltransferase